MNHSLLNDNLSQSHRAYPPAPQRQTSWPSCQLVRLSHLQQEQLPSREQRSDLKDNVQAILALSMFYYCCHIIYAFFTA